MLLLHKPDLIWQLQKDLIQTHTASKYHPDAISGMLIGIVRWHFFSLTFNCKAVDECESLCCSHSVYLFILRTVTTPYDTIVIKMQTDRNFFFVLPARSQFIFSL